MGTSMSKESSRGDPWAQARYRLWIVRATNWDVMARLASGVLPQRSAPDDSRSSSGLASQDASPAQGVLEHLAD